MEIDSPASIDWLPAELIDLILQMCDSVTVRAFSHTCRRHRCMWPRRIDTVHLRPGAPPALIWALGARTAHLCATLTGPADQWTAVSTSQTLSSMTWLVAATPSRMGAAASAYELSALPIGLQTLRLTAAAPLGPMLQQSLCSSLFNAMSLTQLNLDGISLSDLFGVVNGLAARTGNPYAVPLQSLHASVSDEWPTHDLSLSMAGIRDIVDLRIRCPILAVPPRVSDGVSKLVDAFLVARASSAIGMTRFEYEGWPLQHRAAFTAILASSIGTMRNLVFPPFCGYHAEATFAEVCVDRMEALETLYVLTEEARLEFMLANKPRLHTLVHTGRVWNVDILVARLAGLRQIRHFQLASVPTPELANNLYALLQWPSCQFFRVGEHVVVT